MKKLKIEEVLSRSNMDGITKLSEAIAKGQTIKPPVQSICARYGEDDWIKAIRTQKWNKISKMYNSTGFGVIARIGNYLLKYKGDEK